MISHPQVCGSYVKQTSYFLDRDYDLAETNFVRHCEDKNSSFLDFFTTISTETDYLLEASPDYMYSYGTPEKLRKYFAGKDLTLVFLLRDPVDRFVSWFQHGKQLGRVPDTMTFSEYVKVNKVTKSGHMSFRALETGEYSRYIAKFRDTLPPSTKIFVLSFEELVAMPDEMMPRLCCLLGIDSEYYKQFEFGKFNQSRSMKSKKLDTSVRWVSNFLRAGLMRHAGIYQLMTPILRRASEVYRSMNSTRLEKYDVVKEDELVWLKSYYKNYTDMYPVDFD